MGISNCSILRVIVYCAVNNHHISFSFSNHSLYTLVGELHRRTSRLCIVLSITTTSLILSPCNHSLYTSASELHKSTSSYRLCIVLYNHHISYSFSNHSLYTLVGELHRRTSRLCIVLSITTTYLVLFPIILSMLQPVSYIEVQVDCVLCYKINNHHISYSFSNHSLYASASELHRSTSRLCIML